jgi:hypothetical protein
VAAQVEVHVDKAPEYTTAFEESFINTNNVPTYKTLFALIVNLTVFCIAVRTIYMFTAFVAIMPVCV